MTPQAGHVGGRWSLPAIATGDETRHLEPGATSFC